MNVERLSRVKIEAAFAAYIIAKQSEEDTPAAVKRAKIEVRKGQLNEDGTFTVEGLEDAPDMPLIAVACPDTKRHEMGFGYVIGATHIIVMGAVDPVPTDPTQPVSGGNPLNNPKADHDQITGWIGALWLDSNLVAAAAAMSPPKEGDDTRVVRDFTCFGLVEDNDISQETARHWIDDFTLSVHCSPTDDTSL